MELWLAIVLGFIIFTVILALIAIIAWFIIVAFYLPLTNDTGTTSVLTYAIMQFLAQLFSGFFVIPSSLLTAVVETVGTLRENLPYVLALALGVTVGFVWLEYHPELIKAGLIFRQCSVSPIVDNLVLPILNIVRIFYNAAIGIWNFWASIFGFLRYGSLVVLFKCANSTLSISQLAAYIGIFLRTLFADFSTWLMDDPLFNEFNIEQSIETFANIFLSALPILNCFCEALDFVWIYLTTLIGLPSLSATLNRGWITFINIFQVPFTVIRAPDRRPNFTNLTLNGCATVIGAGDFFQEVVFLTSETLYGLITNETDFPDSVAAALSVRYTYIITRPICALFRVGNMTVVAAANFRNLDASTGVGYFQFGHVFDELKAAAFQIGDLVDIIDEQFPTSERVQGQSLVTATLYAIIDIFAFLFEFIIGNLFYFIYGGPLPASFGLYNQNTSTSGPADFLQYYFVDYWFKAIPFGQPVINPIDNSTIPFPIKLGNYTYSSALDSFFRNVFQASQALGDILGLFNVVFGQLVRHFINIFAALLLAIANQIAYSFCLLTGRCGNMPITARYVNVDLFFNETLFFAGAAGDLFRQYDNASCTNNTLDANKTILCLTGEIVETTIDVFVLATQEVVHFVQDVLTLPSGQIRFCIFETVNVSEAQCVRIPDFTTAITELDDDLCAFGYAVTALIPFTPSLQCPFRPESNITRTCTEVQTCLGFEFCSILRFIPLVLQILNTLLINIITGTAFANFEEFLTFSIGLLVNQFAVVLEQFALFLDCSACTIEGVPAGGCRSPVFDIVKPIADAIRQLAQVFTGIFLTFVRIVLVFVVGLFSGNPVTAIIDFVFAFIQNVFVAAEFAIIDFVDQLLHRIGLGFLGTFIRILYTGFCTVLELIINAIIGILKIVTFNTFPHDYVQFCCSEGGCVPHVGSRKRMDTVPFVVGNVTMANIDNWLVLMTEQQMWPPHDPCNASITGYSELPFTTLNTYQFGEVLFCVSKLIWTHRTDNQSDILPLTCDRLILESMNASFSLFSISDQGTIMECALKRMATEGVRHKLNISWLPQDIATNPARTVYFGLGLAQGILLNSQFFNDKTLPPTVILSSTYQQFWTKMHVDTSRYNTLKTEEDVVLFKETLTLQSYFDANQASQYDATLYVVTGLWSFADSLFSGLMNMTESFSDNVTDAGVYLSSNQTEDAGHAILTAVFGLFTQLRTTVGKLTSHWSDPDSYRKRSEAYRVMSSASERISGAMMSSATVVAYKESVRQWVLMAREYKETKVYEANHFYNQSCATEEQCRAEGVTQFREAYEASMRTTSFVYKFSKWWDNVDFTAIYPIQNPRYKDVQVKAPPPLYYTDQEGVVRPDTRWQRFWRNVAIVRQGTPAAQRRWAIATALYERTRDKFYTQVLKHYYREKYTTVSDHHFFMQQQHLRETGAALVQQHPKGNKVCTEANGCVTRYSYNTMAYDENQLSSPLDRPCINNISFPCRYPLRCDGNTTTLCVQCYYLQALVDRSVAATDQVLTYYGPDGRFSRSLTTAFQFFNYTFDPNARVIVGDSPQLHVALFPAQGDGFFDFVIQSARYLGDDTPNKTRFNRFIDQFDRLVGSRDDLETDVRQSSLFSRPLTDINDQVFAVISEIFQPVFQFLYSVVLYLTSASEEGGEFAEDVVDDFVFCDWLEGRDLDGTQKHFSIGETLALYALLIAAGNTFSVALFGFDLFSLLVTNMITGMIFASTFLTVYTNWAYLCAPAIPVNLADDIFYFIAYTLSAKCSWLFGFMMNSEYDNDTCYSCENARNAVLTHCRYNEGFFDFTYNAAFVLYAFLPDVVQDITTGTGLSRIFSAIPFIANRLAFFTDVNLADPFVWARYQGCNWVITLWWNLAIFILATTALLIIAGPASRAISAIFTWLWDLAAQGLVIVMLIVSAIMNNPYFSPQYPDDGSITGNANSAAASSTDAGDDDGDGNTTTTSMPREQDYNSKPNGFQLAKLYNFLSFVRDNLIGDRKRK